MVAPSNYGKKAAAVNGGDGSSKNQPVAKKAATATGSDKAQCSNQLVVTKTAKTNRRQQKR